MRANRLQQVLIGILAVLSLSISSIAACMCSHHEQDPQPKNSCHGPAKQDPRDQAGENHPAFSESCICVQSAAKLSVKSEGFKLKKQPTAAGATPLISLVTTYSALLIFDIDSLSSLRETQPSGSISSRGPPRS